MNEEFKKAGYRRVDDLGRVTIPAELREKYNINIHDKIDFICTENGILLKRVYDKCIFCSNKENLTYYNQIPYCEKCKEIITK